MAKFDPLRTTLLAAIGMCLAAATARAQVVAAYVDPSIAAASCTNYSDTTRTCGTGSATAYKTLSAATQAAGPGSIVQLRGGTYREGLVLSRSGTSGQPIVFKRYGNETPTITGVSLGISAASREYVEVDGVTVTDVSAWGRLVDSRYLTIRNSTFLRATSNGTTGSIKLVRSKFNKILDNTISDGNDNIVMVDAADNNLIQGNTITTGRHSLLSIRCSNYNVFRANTFNNPSQKAIEIYDCEGVGSDNPIRYDSTKHNVFEANHVTSTRASTTDNDYNAIQHGAQHTIVRRNVFRNNLGGGVNFQEYTNESVYVYGNRMYNNTLYANRCYGIVGDRGTTNYRDQRVKNNLLYKNVDCAGGAVQTRIPDTGAVILTSNAIETSAPGFVDEAALDLRLVPTSRLIDAGAALTTAAASGSGISLRVQDATYFHAGHSIPGELGDTIQFLGRADRAVIVGIDYATNTLQLDRPLSWSSGDGLALAFSGNAPDMGAYELNAGGSGGGGGSGSTTPPSAPENIRMIR